MDGTNEIQLRIDSLSKKEVGFKKIRNLSAYFYGLDFRGSIGNGSLPIMHCADKCQLSIRQENKKLSGILRTSFFVKIIALLYNR